MASDRGAFSWHELISGDGDRAKTFYDAALGWDISRACKAVTEVGGKLLGEPQQIPGGEYSVLGHHPEGATFGLVGPRKE